MSEKDTILFLCSRNTCRSQMAEGFVRKIAGDRFEVLSAGLQAGEAIDPLAVQVMGEVGIDISSQRPKSVQEYLGKRLIHWLVVVCEQANEQCPRDWPMLRQDCRVFWDLPDPAAVMESPQQRLRAFREARDSIRAKLELWLASH